MKNLVRAAAVQLTSTTDRERNLRAAERLLAEAAGRGAELVVLPELFPCLGTYEEATAAAETVPGPLSEHFSQLAARHNITLLAGSMCERDAASSKCFNTSLLFAPSGALMGQYRKIHLFDVDLPDGVSLRESEWFVAGSAAQSLAAECGRCGMAICYDLRFPELFRQLSASGAEILLIPAAFTTSTGRDHWHALVRTRAIENQAYVIAANQAGRHSANLHTFGHSLIVDPWGNILSEAGEEGEAVIVADLAGERLRELREQFPVLRHRRL